MNHDTSRRRFLHVVAQGGTAVCAASIGFGCGAGGSGGTISAGNVSALSIGSLNPVSGESVAIGRDAAGVYAMSLICTHQSCDMSSQGTVSATRITCSCHGSVFDGSGAVLTGPANTPLPHYAVTISTAGAISIDLSTEVVASTRTAV